MPEIADGARERVVARGRISRLIPIALAVCYAAQCAWFIGTQSFTYDEPVHVIAGLDAWRHGRFELWNDQPPLGRLLITAPLIIAGHSRWQIEDRGPSGANFWTVSIRPEPVALAWVIRPVNVALGLVLAALLWTTTRRLFSTGAANVALALFACSPALVAHFSLATVDGTATLFLFAAAAAVARWRSHQSWPATIGVGALLGGLLASKFSAPPMVVLALGFMIATGRASLRAAAKGATAATLAVVIVWATYAFHVGPVTFRGGDLAGPYARGHSVIVPFVPALDVTMNVPAPEYISALGGVLQHGVRGQPSFLLGEVKTSGGWHRYFPIVAVLKWPMTTWMLAVAAGVLLLRRRVRATDEFAVMMAFPLSFFVLATLTNLNIGDRYILPVYPFLLLLCGSLWTATNGRRARAAAVVFLVALQAADTLRYAPDALSYFNAFVQPDSSYTRLTDSNLDWGQGLIALRTFERDHPTADMWLAYFGGVDPASYGIRAKPLGEHDRVRGTVVVSATHLSGQYLHDPQAYHWLMQHPRTAILNHTLHVFDVSDGDMR